MHTEIIQFRTPWGRFPVTRAERYRLARLHGLGDAEARRLAYGEREAPERCGQPHVARGTYTAEELARAFEADGTARTDANGHGIIPRAAPERVPA